jgi:hypothetical protein
MPNTTPWFENFKVSKRLIQNSQMPTHQQKLSVLL